MPGAAGGVLAVLSGGVSSDDPAMLLLLDTRSCDTNVSNKPMEQPAWHDSVIPAAGAPCGVPLLLPKEKRKSFYLLSNEKSLKWISQCLCPVTQSCGLYNTNGVAVLRVWVLLLL